MCTLTGVLREVSKRAVKKFMHILDICIYMFSDFYSYIVFIYILYDIFISC